MKSHGWDIFWRSNWNKNVSNCYYYTTLKKKKCKNQKFGKRFSRTVGKGGTWSGVDNQPIRNQKGVLIGCKKNFVYEKRGSAQHGRWLMKEFSLDGALLDHVKRLKQENVISHSFFLCIICYIVVVFLVYCLELYTCDLTL
ncbi:hypothetical protein LOK49_LG03G02951 [Camellia lanceoleosa]|uniref:Uncharacterized protein n=1 Tax=Camellia lanceoleosa TaxID=1840588 RepID=A0ACC0IFK3_9ERIC|nr:hypothetical protein LOK49_LG03G02951 [Camellia lanceoleosa]